MKWSFQVKAIVNIVIVEVLNTEWIIDELYICAEDVLLKIKYIYLLEEYKNG